MTTAEEIVLRMGFDASAVQRGTAAMMDVQKKAASDYTSFWKRAIKEREEAEIAADVRSAARANRARQLLRDRAIIQAERQSIINAEIAAGSIPQNLVGKTVQAAEKKTLSNTESIIIGGAAGSIVIGFLKHLAVFVKDMASGQWEKAGMAISKIGIGLSSIPVIGAGILAIYGNVNMRSSLKDQAGRYGTDTSLQETRAMQIKSLSDQIALLEHGGRLNGGQAGNLQNILSRGGDRNISAVQGLLRGLLPHGFETKQQVEDMLRLDEEHRRKVHESEREQMTASARVNDDLMIQSKLKFEMAYLDKNSIEYKRKQLELDDAIRNGQEDIKAIKDAQLEQEKKAADLQNSKATRISELIKSDRLSLSQSSAEYPTLENLAGRMWTRKFQAQYGPGGRFDLGRGNGPYADIARDYIESQQQQMWDRTMGNTKDADLDRIRMMNSLTKLSQFGAASPEQNMQIVADRVDKMEKSLRDLVKGGAIINTKITETDN